MKVVSLFVLAALAMPAAAQQPAPKFTDPGRRAAFEKAFPEIEKIFENYRQKHGIPGLSFGVVIDGELAFAKGLGVRDMASKDPVTPDTVFRIASMTKSFTALAILKLRDDGKLSLDDLASKYIPELANLKYPTHDSPPLRVRHLLTHSSGLPEDNPWGDRQLDASEETLTRWLEAGLPFSTSPGTAYEYSNYAFGLLGRIVSKASGMPYTKYVEKNILGPLGMKDSTLETGAVNESVRAKGYRKEGDGYADEPSLPDGVFGSMGGMLTSGRDLGRYVAYQLSAYPPRDEEETGPVKRSSMREMQSAWRPSSFGVTRPTPDAPLQASTSSYGYGVVVTTTCQFDQIVAHSGGLPGFGSHMRWLPQYGVGIYGMANLTYDGPRVAIEEAFEALRKTGALKPRDLPPSEVLISTRKTLLSLWQHWDDQEAEKIAANNLFLDTPAKRRREEIERIKADMGKCDTAGEVIPENFLRGKFQMSCENGSVTVAFTMAPTMPPTVQYLSFVPAKTMSKELKASAESLAALVGSPSEKRLGSLSASSLDRKKVWREVEALHSEYGQCKVGETFAGDGSSDASMRFECTHGPLDVRLHADGKGKFSSVAFTRPPDTPCVP